MRRFPARTPLEIRHEEAEIKGCGACLKALEDKVKQFMQDGQPIDTSFLKSCYKAVLTVPASDPINVLNYVLVQYAKKFANVVYGKFGGFGHDGERILLFYEGSVEGAEKRLGELKEILEEHNITGKLSYSVACEYMHYHLDIGKKSRVRQAETLLKRCLIGFYKLLERFTAFG